MPMKAFDNVKINHHHTSGLFISDNLKSKPTWVTPQARPMIESIMSALDIAKNYISHLNFVADVIRTHIWLKPYQMSLGDVWSACVSIELLNV